MVLCFVILVFAVVHIVNDSFLFSLVCDLIVWCCSQRVGWFCVLTWFCDVDVCCCLHSI